MRFLDIFPDFSDLHKRTFYSAGITSPVDFSNYVTFDRREMAMKLPA